MRRFLTVAACGILAGVLVTGAAAQKPGAGAAGPPQGQGGEHRQGGMMMGGFMKDLNLTAAQKAKMEAIQKKQMDQMKAIRNMKLTEDERRAKMRALFEGTQKQIRGLLTAAQQKKWDEQMKKMRERRGGFGRPGGGPPPTGKAGGGR